MNQVSRRYRDADVDVNISSEAERQLKREQYEHLCDIGLVLFGVSCTVAAVLVYLFY
jgi:hypothetical protein